MSSRSVHHYANQVALLSLVPRATQAHQQTLLLADTGLPFAGGQDIQYWTSSIRTIQLDGSDPRDIHDLDGQAAGTSIGISALTIDQSASHLYLATGGGISCTNLDGTAPFQVNGGKTAMSLALTENGSALYWGDSGTGLVNRANMMVPMPSRYVEVHAE
jgi:hypothetical protein